jgi:hypothetical protein
MGASVFRPRTLVESRGCVFDSGCHPSIRYESRTGFSFIRLGLFSAKTQPWFPGHLLNVIYAISLGVEPLVAVWVMRRRETSVGSGPLAIAAWYRQRSER